MSLPPPPPSPASPARPVLIVTGGAGFVGSWLVKAFRDQMSELKVIVLDRRKPEDWNGAQNGFLEVDVTNGEAVFRALEKVKPLAIVHAAGMVPTVKERYSTSRRVAEIVHDVNVNGTRNLLAAAKKVGVQYFIYTSSTTVIIDDPSIDHPNMTEALPTGRATLMYGQTKAIAEDLVLEANNIPQNFKTCSLRPSVIFGPGDNNCIPTIRSCIAKGETAFVIGDPNKSLYDFTYVENVGDAHVLALRNLMSSSSSPTTATTSAAGRAFFITNGEPLPFRNFCLAVWKEYGHIPRWQVTIPLHVARFAGLLAEMVTWATGATTTLSRGSVRDYTMTAYCNIASARTVLGYEPRVSLQEGIRRSCV